VQNDERKKYGRPSQRPEQHHTTKNIVPTSRRIAKPFMAVLRSAHTAGGKGYLQTSHNFHCPQVGNIETRWDMNRTEKIAKRRADMPRAYRQNYDKAVQGKSLRAAINAQCLECVCWEREEIRRCTCLACPLWAVRPYQESPQSTHNEAFSGVESTNGSKEG
jgi:hypothetical protein